MKNVMRLKIIIGAIIFLILTVSLYGQGLIIDHNAVQMFDLIPEYWLEKAKELTVHYGHTSHGSQIIAGLNYFETYVDPVKYSMAIRDRNDERMPILPAEETPKALRMWEEGLWPYTDGSKLGYWDGQAAQNGTRSVLQSGLFDVSGWCWCGEVADKEWPYIQEYLDVMVMFEQEFPNIKFIYMTGHCVAPGPPPYQQKTYERLQNNNNGIREFCKNNNKILYDFADIEAWDLDGNYHPEEDASCVWCEEWCNNHPDECQNIPVSSESGGGSLCTHCAHTHGLNCVIKARAFWYMMARLAGWDGQIAVAVELMKFEGHNTDEGVKLFWQTSSEQNNYGFEIERSRYYSTKFEKIGFVNGKGCTRIPNEYNFIDKSIIQGVYYYRLKQIDNDGNFNYLGTVEISVNLPNKFRLNQNYPNPFNASTVISYSLEKKSHVELTIYDINSKAIHKLVNEFQKHGYYNITWDARDYSSGPYFYQLKANEINMTKKMMLVK